MFFKCKNCGGNTVYSPEKHVMYCPFCEGEATEEKAAASTLGMNICENCGGEIPLEQYTSAIKCPYCGSYHIIDERVEGEYTPQKILPFQLGKEACKEAIRERLRKVIFAPDDILSESKLDCVQGMYVPYWLYDYQTNAQFVGEGTRTRVWTAGSTEYTETSYYSIVRDIDIPYHLVPADASIKMPDNIMDLAEPFDYQKVKEFKPEFMSGFDGECYNMPAEELSGRAENKIKASANALLRESYAGYSSITEMQKSIHSTPVRTTYCLMPVWIYNYSYKGDSRPFYVNGQTGKVIGMAPLSKKKAWCYTLTVFTCIMAALNLAFYLLLG